MAVKGAVNTSIDVNELSSLIVFARRYAEEVSAAANEIRTLCAGMAEEESLKGGDGEAIRDQFAKIGTAYASIDRSVQYIVNVLNDKLKTSLQMTHTTASGVSEDAVAQASKQAGVFKKQ